MFDLSGIRVVSWDVDGTLFSFFHLGLQLLRNLSCKEIWEVLKFHRSIEKQRRTTECRVMHVEGSQQIQAWEKVILGEILSKLPPRKKAVELITYFSKSGTVQVALSDFESDYKLEALGLREHFAKTYSCQKIGFWKPSPVPLVNIQSDFDIRPEQHLHIGDRMDADGEACLRNGCRFLLI